MRWEYKYEWKREIGRSYIEKLQTNFGLSIWTKFPSVPLISSFCNLSVAAKDFEFIEKVSDCSLPSFGKKLKEFIL